MSPEKLLKFLDGNSRLVLNPSLRPHLGNWEARLENIPSSVGFGLTPEAAIEGIRVIQDGHSAQVLRHPQLEEGALSDKITLYCTFCGKSQHEVSKLIAGPTVFICNECAEVCDIILIEQNFPDRIVIRIKVPNNTEFDDALYSAISHSVSEIYPDVDLKYELRTTDTDNDGSIGNYAIFSFAKIYGELPENSVISEEYNSLSTKLADTLSKLTVTTEMFINESDKAKRINDDLIALKAEYLDYIRKHNSEEKDIDDLRAIMFLDISGFSKFDEDYKKKVTDLLRGIAPPFIKSKGANDINMWGDAIVANFVDANVAVETAVKFLRHLSVERLDARIGLSWGKIRISYNPATRRPDIDGPIVDLAARLEAMAPVGGILLSKEFAGLEINESIGKVSLTRRSVTKAFSTYDKGDMIDCCTIDIYMN